MSIKYKYLLVFTISVFYLTNLIKSESEITCKDENGNTVDWFYLYKLPGRFGIDSKEKGRLYLYFSSSSADAAWRLSNRTVDSLDSVIGQTISQAFVNSTTVSHND